MEGHHHPDAVPVPPSGGSPQLKPSPILRISILIAGWVGAFLLLPLLVGAAMLFGWVNLESPWIDRIAFGVFGGVAILSILALTAAKRIRPNTKVFSYAWICGVVACIGLVLIVLSGWLVQGGHPPLVVVVWAVVAAIDLVLLSGIVVCSIIGLIRHEKAALVWGGLGYALVYAWLMYGVLLVPVFHKWIDRMSTPFEQELLAPRFQKEATAKFLAMDSQRQQRVLARLLRAEKEAGGHDPVMPYTSWLFQKMEPPALTGLMPVLVQGLDDEREVTRQRAASALGFCGAACADALPSLMKRLGDEQSPVRYAAAHAIRKMNPPATAGLIDLLESEDQNLRAAAARALNADDPETRRLALPTLCTMLEGPGRDLRYNAETTIREMGYQNEKCREILGRPLHYAGVVYPGIQGTAGTKGGADVTLPRTIGPAPRSASPGRPASVAPPSPIGTMRIRVVSIAGSQAIVRETETSAERTVRVGDVVSGWTVVTIRPGMVEIEREDAAQGGRIRAQLPAALAHLPTPGP
jgi:hypothetical protein